CTVRPRPPSPTCPARATPVISRPSSASDWLSTSPLATTRCTSGRASSRYPGTCGPSHCCQPSQPASKSSGIRISSQRGRRWESDKETSPSGNETRAINILHLPATRRSAPGLDLNPSLLYDYTSNHLFNKADTVRLVLVLLIHAVVFKLRRQISYL